MIHAGADLEQPAMESVFTHRGHIEAYIEQNPDFLHTLAPWPGKGPYPMVVGAMVKAGRQAGVGPMAAVAGAVAEFVGRDLLQHTDEVIVENGGDVFINILKPITISVYAGQSPLSMKLIKGVRTEDFISTSGVLIQCPNRLMPGTGFPATMYRGTKPRQTL